MGIEMDPGKYKKVQFNKIGNPPVERIEVVFVDEWAGRSQGLEEAKRKEISVGHLECRDGRCCADAKLVKELQEHLVEGESWGSLEEAKTFVQSAVLEVYS